MAKRETARQEFKEIERIFISRNLERMLRVGTLTAFEIAGFLYGAEKAGEVYLVKGTPFLDLTACSKERGKVSVDSTFLEHKENLLQRYDSVPGFAYVAYHSHPKPTFEELPLREQRRLLRETKGTLDPGKITELISTAWLSNQDKQFALEHSTHGLAIVLEGLERAHETGSFGKPWAFQVYPNEECFPVSLEVVEDSHSYEDERRYNEILRQFGEIDVGRYKG